MGSVKDKYQLQVAFTDLQKRDAVVSFDVTAEGAAELIKHFLNDAAAIIRIKSITITEID